jgi:hypothetical protein
VEVGLFAIVVFSYFLEKGEVGLSQWVLVKADCKQLDSAEYDDDLEGRNDST